MAVETYQWGLVEGLDFLVRGAAEGQVLKRECTHTVEGEALVAGLVVQVLTMETLYLSIPDTGASMVGMLGQMERGALAEMVAGQFASSGPVLLGNSPQQTQAICKGNKLCGSMNKQKQSLFFTPIFGMSYGSPVKRLPAS